MIRPLLCLPMVWSLLLLIVPDTVWAQEAIGRDEGLPRVHWSEAEQVVGSIALVSGKIVDVGQYERIRFLNFDRRRRDVFKVVIFEEHLADFSRPVKELYDQQLVTVRGLVTRYRGVPQIQVTSSDQIALVDKLPTTRLPVHQPKAEGKQVKVGTFNVQNLFDAVDDPYRFDETTRAKPRRELDELARTIKQLDADVLGLQEVESRGYLQRFVDVFLPAEGYEVVHFAGNDQRGSGVALLTRLPVGAVTSHRHREFRRADGTMTRFRRDLLCIELTPRDGASFEVWVTHLKSKRGGTAQTEAQRVAEASEIRRLLDVHLVNDPEARIVIVGDFNDTDQSKPIRTLFREPVRVIGFAKDIPAGAVTYTRSPYQEVIDYIFCSPGAARGYVPGTHEIRHAPDGQNGSDHNPVVATFEFAE